MDSSSLKSAFRITALPVLVASMCCLSPVILVLLGLSTATFASSLADTLYGEYKWYFRIAGLLLLLASLFFHLRKKHQVCSLDQAKRERNKIINLVALSLIIGILGYLFFLYVIVHYIGVFLSLWA